MTPFWVLAAVCSVVPALVVVFTAFVVGVDQLVPEERPLLSQAPVLFWSQLRWLLLASAVWFLVLAVVAEVARG